VWQAVSLQAPAKRSHEILRAARERLAAPVRDIEIARAHGAVRLWVKRLVKAS
jgi:hypothetical protein